MWYNDILIILMGFVAILMIIMTVIMSARIRKPKPAETVEEIPEKVYVEKGFERQEESEEEETSPDYIEQEPVEEENIEDYSVEVEPIDYTVEIEPVTIDETVSLETEPVEPAPPEEDVVIIPTEPIIIEEASEQIEEPSTENTSDEDVVITPIEPIIIEPEPETEPTTESEPNEDIIITPNETFYDPEPEETEEPTDREEPPSLEGEEAEIEDIPEIELPPLEPEETKSIPEEIEPEPKPEPEAEPVIPVVEGKTQSRRLRKPVIDESDPDLKVDLGVKTCPNCGAKVPDTIYCILCGKPLDPENTVGYEEEEN